MSEKIYAWLLRLYPSHFRETYGDEALQLFRDRARDEKRFFLRLRLWLDLITDLAISLPVEYFRVRPPLVNASAPRLGQGAPSFRMLESGAPNSASLFFGSALSLVALGVFVVLVSRAGGIQLSVDESTPDARTSSSHQVTNSDDASGDDRRQSDGETNGPDQLSGGPDVRLQSGIPMAGSASAYTQAEHTSGGVGAGDQAVACFPVPGADQIWSNPRLRWVLIGGTHGDNETPAAFFNLVCDALGHEKLVTVALEYPSGDQDALDGLLTAGDRVSAQETLLGRPSWKYGMDGRASEAMLLLLTSLRELHRHFPGLEVVAFDVPYASNTPPGAREQAIGRNLLALASRKPDRLVLVLAGDLHAVEEPRFGHDTAAMYLPPSERLSLEVTDRGGESWVRSPEGCGPMKTDGQGGRIPYGVHLNPGMAPDGKFDGALVLGVALTPSAPAAGIPTPLPDCRRQYLAKHRSASAEDSR